MTTIHLKEPFYTAGRRYGWHYLDPTGFGVDTARLNSKSLLVTLEEGGEQARYFIPMDEVKEFRKQYPGSVFQARGKTLLIIPRTLFAKVEEARWD